METTINLNTLAKHFSDEEAAYLLVESMRWPNGPICPHCGEVGNAYFLKPRGGVRLTSKGKPSTRRLWKCAACRKQFSVLVGTIFEDSKVPLSKWLLAIYMMVSNKNGVAAFELHRTLGVTHKTAWFMNHRIREAMKEQPLAEMLSGTIVSDETYIGGKAKNLHRQGSGRRPTGGKDRAHLKAKTPVLTLVNKETGVARSRVIAEVTSATLAKAIAEQVNMAASVLHTDSLPAYKQVGMEFADHQFVDHSSFEYVRGDVSTNQCEGFFSQLKRSVDGTHHHISKEHLGRYLAEFDFRYSTRKESDSDRMARLMGQVAGRRLTYQATVTQK